MLRRIRFFFTFISLLGLALTLFFWLHSRGRHDQWTWECLRLYERRVSTGSLAVSANRFCFNYWFVQRAGESETLLNLFDHVATEPAMPALQNPPIFSQDGFSFSGAGVAIAYHPRGSYYKNPYFGMLAPLWVPLVLFSLLPAYAMYRVIRGRQLIRIGATSFGALTLISTALAILFAVMWLRSHRYQDMLVTDKYLARNYAYFVSADGISRFYFFDEPLRLDGIHWHRYPPQGGNMNLATAVDASSQLAGFGFIHSSYSYQGLFGPAITRPVTILSLPYYGIFAAAAILPALWLVLAIRRFISGRRQRKGRCPNCGYDLRATPNLCPECGYAPGAKAPASPQPTAASQ